MSRKRIDELRKKLKAENLDGMVIAYGDHVRYLTGYTGSNGLLVITPREARFLTDFRYADQAKQQVSGARVSVMKKGDLIAGLSEFPDLNKKNYRYGYSPEYLTVAAAKKLHRSLPDVLLVEADGILAELGWVKDAAEVKLIEKAAKISDIAFERILNIIAPGVKERELAAELEYQMLMLGSERTAFETIVASGPRSAMPHGVASSRKIKKGDFITFDFGATVGGYVSDITRTVVLGKASPRQKKIYGIVLKAQQAGIRKVKAGVKAADVDKVCRNIIKKAGFSKNFGHGTGHGIGYYVHVGPRLAEISQDILRVNNVVTIEPGIYISGWGGVRIEDDVVVTRTRGRVLNKAEKKLLEL
ncbi:MAG: Xaa-Pro peptidase family protein [Candidatus Zixiibacteriota bacterium]|jgi:Xaa-Pro aminopeptidase